MGIKAGGFVALLTKYRYILLLLLLGLLLLLLTADREKQPEKTEPERAEFSVVEEERRLGSALSRIAGAGEVTVLLSVAGGVERTLARDEDGTVIVSAGSGAEEAVELRWSYPEYTGAVVVATGAASATVRLALTEAVMSFTGLGSDKITVIKGEGK